MSQLPLAPPPPTGQPIDGWLYLLWKRLTGTLDIGSGGTGQTTATEAFDALSPTTTQGDLIYHNGTDNVRLPKGTAAQVLTMNVGETAPEWATSSGGASAYAFAFAAAHG